MEYTMKLQARFSSFLSKSDFCRLSHIFFIATKQEVQKRLQFNMIKCFTATNRRLLQIDA